MAELIFTERFVEDAARICSSRVLTHMKNSSASLQRFPNLGSTQIPASVKREFGSTVRKLVVPPFDIIYEYDEGDDTATVLALISSRNTSRAALRAPYPSGT